MKNILKEFDDKCSQLIQSNKLKKSGDDMWELSPSEAPPQHLISFLIHGNEILSLHLVNKILDLYIEGKEQKPLGLLLGNRESYIINKRFVERDLNRSFLTKENKKKEERRAKEIETFSKKFKVILDLHQTSYKAQSAFFLCRNHGASFNMSQYLSVELPIVFLKESKMSSEGEGFATFALKEKIPFLTLELGEKGFHQNYFDLGFKVLKRFISLAPGTLENDFEEEKEVYVFHHTVLKKDPKDTLVMGLENLSPISKGSPLVYRDGKNLEKSPLNGFTLFPKYGEYQKFSQDLCKILLKKRLKDIL